jgi:proline dehydrogenase
MPRSVLRFVRPSLSAIVHCTSGIDRDTTGGVTDVGHQAAGANRSSAGGSSLPEQALRSVLLSLSHRRWLGRMATSVPVTRPMVGRFVAGQSLDEALDAVAGLRDRGFATTLDVLGESVDSPAAARAAAARYVETLDAIADRGLERNVSLKLTQMGLDVDRALVLETVGSIVRRAEELGAFVRIDMEQHTKTDATLGVMREMRKLHPDTGIVIQAALRRSEADVEALIEEGTSVRLCKGAYKEPASVAFTDRADVDESYARLMERLLVAGTRPALATHDPRLIGRAVAIAKREGIARDAFEFQMLYGVRRDLQDRLIAAGYRVRVYVPYGAQWYPYFMRRLAERPQNVAFLVRSVAKDLGKRGG